MIERFRGSKRWQEIAAAKTVHRELEFLLAWPPDGTEPVTTTAATCRDSSIASTKTPAAAGT